MTYMRTAPRSSKRFLKGLAAILGVSATDTIQWIEQVSRGFPYGAIKNFQKVSGFSISDIAKWIGIPDRTMLRRKDEGRLSLEESERLLRAARGFEKAVRLFEGDVGTARQWLTEANPDFDSRTPLEFSKTEVGSRDVE